MSTPDRTPEDSALDRLAMPSLDRLASMMRASGDPARGQLWRARWGTAAELVLLTAVNTTDVTAVPVTPDLDAADDHAVLLRAGEQPLDFDVVAWTQFARPLPMRALDSLFGNVAATALDRAIAGTGTSAPISSLIDERSYVIDEITETMEMLAAASWAPAGDKSFDLDAAMTARGFTASSLATRLNVDPGVVTSFARGRSIPEGDVLAALADALGADESLIIVTPVDADLVAVLDMPRFRHRLAERGREEGFADEAVWRREVASHRLPLAARTAGTVSKRDRYIGLVEHFLR